MKAKQAVVCPKCGALSRPNWEFCARCNESLEGAAPAEGPAPPAEEGGPSASSLPASAIALVAVVALGILGAWAWRHASQAPPPAQPDPSLFTIATRPPELPGSGAPHGARGGRLRCRPAPDELRRPDRGRGAPLRRRLGRPRQRRVPGRLRLRARAQRRPRGGARRPRRGGPPRPPLPDAVRAVARRGRAGRRGGPRVRGDPGQEPRRHDRAGGPRPAALPDGGLQEGRVAPPDRGAEEAERPSAAAGAGVLAGPRRRPRPGRRRIPAGAEAGARRRCWLAACSPTTSWSRASRRRRWPCCRKASRRTPTAPLLQRQMGAVLERSGRPAEAAAAYRAYAQLAPNAPDAKAMADRAARLSAQGGKP